MRRVTWFWTLCRFHRLNLTRPDFFRIKYANDLANDSPCHWNLSIIVSNNVYKYFIFSTPFLKNPNSMKDFNLNDILYLQNIRSSRVCILMFNNVQEKDHICSSERSRLHINTMGQGHWERLKVKFLTSVRTEGWTFALSVIPSLWCRSFLLFSPILRKSYLD